MRQSTSRGRWTSPAHDVEMASAESLSFTNSMQHSDRHTEATSPKTTPLSPKAGTYRKQFSNNSFNRLCTVLATNLLNLHSASTTACSEVVVAQISHMVIAVEAAVTANQGMLTFHGDRCLATINPAQPCASPAVHGAQAALSACHNVTSPPGPLRLKLSCGVATGACLVGNTGSAGLRTFSVVGTAVSDAVLLERMTRLYPDVSVLVSHRTSIDAGTAVSVRYSDLVTFPGREKPRATIVAAIDPREGESGRDTEWMYALQRNEVDPNTAERNRCFEQLLNGDTQGALLRISQLQRASDAVVASLPMAVEEVKNSPLVPFSRGCAFQAHMGDPSFGSEANRRLAAIAEVIREGSVGSINNGGPIDEDVNAHRSRLLLIRASRDLGPLHPIGPKTSTPAFRL
jgi:class 3 adenylate cyclase